MSYETAPVSSFLPNPCGHENSQFNPQKGIFSLNSGANLIPYLSLKPLEPEISISPGEQPYMFSVHKIQLHTFCHSADIPS